MINLEKDRVLGVLLYDDIAGGFTWKVMPNGRVPVGSKAGNITKNGYLRIKIDGHLVMAHRLAWFIEYGEWPKGQIDHINCDKLDNTIKNLRVVNPRKNTENQRIGKRRKNGGTLLGASWAAPNKKWRATICHQGRIKHLGLFLTEAEAHAAYVNEKRKLHEGCTL